MIARFRILLPWIISIPDGEDLQSFSFKENNLTITIHPPLCSPLKYAELADTAELPSQLGERLKQHAPVPRQDIKMDGKPVVQANLLQIDFIKESFDRDKKPRRSPSELDPPLDFMLSIANGILMRIRSVTQAAQIKTLDDVPTVWSVDYLSDNADELPEEPDKIKGLRAHLGRLTILGVAESTWVKVNALPPHFSPTPYDRLLLDAESLMPDLGPAIVMSFAALETLISYGLSVLLQQNEDIDRELWKWILERGDYRKEPSVAEQFDILLRTLSGVSLKDESNLWEAFVKLKDARNNFVHSGILAIGRKKDPLSLEDVEKLIGNAKEIVGFVEKLLPEEYRRPLANEIHEFTREKIIAAVKIPVPAERIGGSNMIDKL